MLVGCYILGDKDSLEGMTMTYEIQQKLRDADTRINDLSRMLDDAKADCAFWQRRWIEERALKDHYVQMCDEEHRGLVAERSLWLRGHTELQKRISELELRRVEMSTPSVLITPIGFQLVSEVAITWLHDEHPEIYNGFYERVDTPNKNLSGGR